MIQLPDPTEDLPTVLYAQKLDEYKKVKMCLAVCSITMRELILFTFWCTEGAISIFDGRVPALCKKFWGLLMQRK